MRLARRQEVPTNSLIAQAMNALESEISERVHGLINDPTFRVAQLTRSARRMSRELTLP